MANSDGRFIDPMFYIPDGVENFSRSETDDSILTDDFSEDVSLDDELGVLESDSYVVDDSDITDGYDSPETPDILGILPPQVIRTLADGSSVVDVVFDVEDIPGTTKYEFRVTKI